MRRRASGLCGQGEVEVSRTIIRPWNNVCPQSSSAQRFTICVRSERISPHSSRRSSLTRRMNDPSDTAGLTGDALRIALERPSGWALKLLARLIQDEVSRAAELRHDHGLQLVFGVGEQVSEAQATAWSGASFDQVVRMIEALETIFGRAMEASNSKNISAIRHSARLIGQVYRDCFEWAARLRRAHVPEDRRTMLSEQSFMLDNVIRAIEELGTQIIAETEKALAIAGDDEEIVRVQMHVSIANKDRYDAAFAEFQRKRGI